MDTATSFFSSPRLNREASTSSESAGSCSSSSDDTEIATPPTTGATSSSMQQQAVLQFSSKRAHYRTTDMLAFEGRDSPSQVWICNRKPRSPLPGYVTPSLAEQTQECYFGLATPSNSDALGSDSPRPQSPDCLHLGHRPKFVHSETVPDVQALQQAAEEYHNHHHKRSHLRQAQNVEDIELQNNQEDDDNHLKIPSQNQSLQAEGNDIDVGSQNISTNDPMKNSTSHSQMQ